MKSVRNNVPLLLILIFLFIFPATADALFWLKGTSHSGEMATAVALVIPVPAINTLITESSASDLFGIASLDISGHDDLNAYNTLRIAFSEEDALQVPIPYGAFGLSYRLMPNRLPLTGRDESDLYWYLSVDKDSVTADTNIATDYTFTVERDKLMEFITPFIPEIEFIEPLIGPGPFEFVLSLHGEFSGTATEASPTIAGSIDYAISLPEDMFTQEIPMEIPLQDSYEGTVSMEATFDWSKWMYVMPFVSVTISVANSFEEQEYAFEPMTFDLLPRGTFTFWFDR